MIPIFLLTLAFAIGIGFLFATTDRQDVMAHWDEKRCNLPVMFMGNLYKPANNPKSDTEFATDNFTFCASKSVENAIKVVSAPVLELMNQQLDIFGELQKVLGSVREMIGNFFRSFSNLVDGMFQRFIAINFEMRRIFIDFFQMMSRASAMGMSAVFMGMSAIIGIQNMYDFVVKVVLIILGILASIIIVLFFILFPVMPIILTTVSVLVAAGVGGTSGFAGVFCFAPSTLIRLKNGSEVPIDAIHIGDILQNGEKVEGILKADGSATNIYNLGNIRVSGDHLVYFEPLNEWILVKEHPHAYLEVKKEPVLYCLNTTNHRIQIGGYLFSDWEEIPSDSIEDWNKFVGRILVGTPAKKAVNYPLLSGAWFVKGPNGKKTRIRDIQLGDILYDTENTATTVLGKYCGQDEIEEESIDTKYWLSDSVWILKGGAKEKGKEKGKGKGEEKEKGKWKQKGGSSHASGVRKMLNGFHLITDSGTFTIYNDSESESDSESFHLRDFTEVGVRRISETYAWTKKTIS